MKAAEETLLYEVYVTDVLKAIFSRFGGEVSSRFYDLLTRSTKVETRSADEIIASIKDKVNVNTSEV